MRKLTLCCLAFIVASLASTLSARAQAMLTFAGGNGTPLSITLNAPVTYVVTTAPSYEQPAFVFQGLGNLFGGNYQPFYGYITVSVNGVFFSDLYDINSGITAGAITANDTYIVNPTGPSLKVGDVVVLLIFRKAKWVAEKREKRLSRARIQKAGSGAPSLLS